MKPGLATGKDRYKRNHPVPPDPRPGAKFNPMGFDYDYASAKKAGLKPDKTGYWPSRDPKTGMLLKGRGHKTWHKTVKGEEEAGYEIYKNPKDGRYYSRKKK